MNSIQLLQRSMKVIANANPNTLNFLLIILRIGVMKALKIISETK